MTTAQTGNPHQCRQLLKPFLPTLPPSPLNPSTEILLLKSEAQRITEAGCQDGIEKPDKWQGCSKHSRKFTGMQPYLSAFFSDRGGHVSQALQVKNSNCHLYIAGRISLCIQILTQGHCFNSRNYLCMRICPALILATAPQRELLAQLSPFFCMRGYACKCMYLRVHTHIHMCERVHTRTHTQHFWTNTIVPLLHSLSFHQVNCQSTKVPKHTIVQ